MRRILLLLLIAMAIAVNAKEPIKFMGIPVQGSVDNMVKQLESKGFKLGKYYCFMNGKFGGEWVQLVLIDYGSGDVKEIRVQYILNSLIEVREYYNNLFSKLQESNKYHYGEGKKIIYIGDIENYFNKNEINKEEDKFVSTFYQTSRAGESLEECLSRRVQLNINPWVDETWCIFLDYINEDVMLDDNNNDY